MATQTARIDAAMSEFHNTQVVFNTPQARIMTICEWARVMVSAANSTLPAVKADRLRAASEFRTEIAQGRGQ